MNEICNLANARITSVPPSALARSVMAQRLDPAFEVRLQDVHWSSRGQSSVQTGGRCMLEMLLMVPSITHTEYSVIDGRGVPRMVGRMNFLAPKSAIDLHWSPGHARSIVCMFDPVGLGVVDRQLGGWDGVDPLSALDIKSERLEATFGWLHDELLQPSFASQLQITSILTLLAVETQRYFGAPQLEGDVGCAKLSPRQLAEVKDRIEQALPDSVPLQELAAACGLSSRDLPTMFKNTVGITLRSFVAASHIAKAKLLLSDSRMLIKQVAGLSGFESASAFTSAFRKATGMRPQQYREAHGIWLRTDSDHE